MEAWLEKDMLEPDFPFRLFENSGGAVISPHWHEEIEIIYMIEGKVSVGIGNKIYNLSKGDILLIGSGDIHYFFPEKAASQRLVIQFGLSLFDTSSPGKAQAKSVKPIFKNAKKISSEWEEDVKIATENDIKEIVRENEEKNTGYQLALKARLYDIAVLLIRNVPKDDEDLDDGGRHRENLKKLQNVIDYVESNYSEKITLEKAANIAGFSTYHFTRFFKKNTGITFIQYLNNFRITKAEWFLLNEDDTITQIAYKTGFKSIKTFNKVFKEIKGCSPSQYRKKQNMRSS
jgi:AraC-like DNA-binding protein